MQLRIFRTWKWEAVEPTIWQTTSLVLTGYDELQYRNHKNEWLPLPVIEAEKPEHPDTEKSRKNVEKIQEMLEQLPLGEGEPK